ncbi:hypothetical protein L1887_54086 [Cichorium endivia]|nr:hypothetical protein L1887_54086 [Cichorium endivia]
MQGERHGRATFERRRSRYRVRVSRRGLGMHHAEGHGWLAEETLNVSAEAWVLSVRRSPQALFFLSLSSEPGRPELGHGSVHARAAPPSPSLTPPCQDTRTLISSASKAERGLQVSRGRAEAQQPSFS